jgi:transcription termination factor Rho
VIEPISNEGCSKAESNVNEKKVGKVIKFNKSAYEKKIALKRIKKR